MQKPRTYPGLNKSKVLVKRPSNIARLPVDSDARSSVGAGGLVLTEALAAPQAALCRRLHLYTRPSLPSRHLSLLVLSRTWRATSSVNHPLPPPPTPPRPW